MPKRKLTKQQQTRIREQQEKSRQQSQQSDSNHLQGRVIQHHGKQAIVETKTGELLLCKIRQNLGNIVCGDKVTYQAGPDNKAAVILAVMERSSVLSRPDFRKKNKPFAANVDQIVIVMAIEPEPSLHLLDRYLVVVENTGLQGVIVINKTDLADQESLQTLQSQMQLYENLDYPILFCSAKKERGLDELLNKLSNKTSILVGQSGVGKSSIVHSLIPELDIRTGELSQASHGKHTTSSSTLYHLHNDGDIIDSPGVRDFSMWHITREQITDGFREFTPYIGSCRFHNCQHLNEPDCAIKNAAANGEISDIRLQSYQDMITEIKAEN